MEEILIKKLRYIGDGGRTVEITVERERDERKYIISGGAYREIGCPPSGSYISCEVLSEISSEDESLRARTAALRALGYSDKSIFALRQKLRTQGFSRPSVDSAIEYCTEMGYIDEERSLKRLISDMAERGLLGPYKIRAKLIAKGYSSSLINACIRSLTQSGELDFEYCLGQLLKKHGSPTGEEKNKLLYKFGYRK